LSPNVYPVYTQFTDEYGEIRTGIFSASPICQELSFTQMGMCKNYKTVPLNGELVAFIEFTAPHNHNSVILNALRAFKSADIENRERQRHI